jgi:hypothetical protein
LVIVARTVVDESNEAKFFQILLAMVSDRGGKCGGAFVVREFAVLSG